MEVKFILPSQLYAKGNIKREQVFQAETVEEGVQKLASSSPYMSGLISEDGSFGKFVALFSNGRRLPSKEMKKHLEEDIEVSLIVSISGG